MLHKFTEIFIACATLPADTVMCHIKFCATKN